MHHGITALFPEVNLINSGGNLGFARANNLAIPKCDTPFILFLNPDTLIIDDSLQVMIEFMKDNAQIGAVGCKMKDADGLVQPLGLQWFPSPLTELLGLLFISTGSRKLIKKYLPLKDPEMSGPVSKLYGGCLMVRREVLNRVGYFDERFFMYGEDVDLCRRIHEDGWKLYYLSEAEIIHLCGGASGKTISQFSTLMKCESISKLMGKYYGKKGLILYKLAIFSGSQIRLLILRFLKLLLSVTSSQSRLNYDESLNKYKAMVKWSLNLQKPVVKE
jgi:GT2 family glycosyltransferase